MSATLIEAARLSLMAGAGPYAALSASDNTDEWPFWYVAGPDGRRNVLEFDAPFRGAVFAPREMAKAIAHKFNEGRS